MQDEPAGPRKVYVEPTNACNLACAHLRAPRLGRARGVHGVGDVRGGRRRADGCGGEGPGGEAPPAVAFMGLGEPLLHPRFLDMVRLAKERGLRAEVTTNALLLDDALAAGLLEAGLDQLVVSIDGASAEAFGRVRSGASLERVVENVRRLHDGRGPNYGPGTRIGVEFVAMRSNVGELPGLGRLAAQLGATFIIVSNVLAYTPELLGETLYDHRASSLSGARDHGRAALAAAGVRLGRAARRRARRGAHPLGAGLVLRRRARRPRAATVPSSTSTRAPSPGTAASAPARRSCTPTPASCAAARSGCCAGRWAGCPDETLAAVWAAPDYVAFRDRVRRFDFPPCTDCGCELAEANEEDCLGNPHPTCGDCLWARGVVRCA